MSGYRSGHTSTDGARWNYVSVTEIRDPWEGRATCPLIGWEGHCSCWVSVRDCSSDCHHQPPRKPRFTQAVILRDILFYLFWVTYHAIFYTRDEWKAKWAPEEREKREDVKKRLKIVLEMWVREGVMIG